MNYQCRYLLIVFVSDICIFVKKKEENRERNDYLLSLKQEPNKQTLIVCKRKILWVCLYIHTVYSEFDG